MPHPRTYLRIHTGTSRRCGDTGGLTGGEYRSSIFETPRVFFSARSRRRCLGGGVYRRQRHRSSFLLLKTSVREPHFGLNVCMPAFEKVPAPMRQRLASLTGGETRLIGGSSDTVYIPRASPIPRTYLTVHEPSPTLAFFDIGRSSVLPVHGCARDIPGHDVFPRDCPSNGGTPHPSREREYLICRSCASSSSAYAWNKIDETLRWRGSGGFGTLLSMLHLSGSNGN